MFFYSWAPDKWSRVLIVGNIALLAALWFFSAWRFFVSPDFIPLHYTVYFGFDRFGPRNDIFLFPILASVIFGANLAVARRVLSSRILWRRAVLSLTLLLEASLLLSLVLVILKGLY
jgi:hypothetical protein